MIIGNDGSPDSSLVMVACEDILILLLFRFIRERERYIHKYVPRTTYSYLFFIYDRSEREHKNRKGLIHLWEKYMGLDSRHASMIPTCDWSHREGWHQGLTTYDILNPAFPSLCCVSVQHWFDVPLSMLTP